ncbi:hypothetical protein HK096_007470, partial [Nowakowskiella sp. JEL0078]
KENENETQDNDKTVRPKKHHLTTIVESEEKIQTSDLQIEPLTKSDKNLTIRPKKGIKDMKSTIVLSNMLSSSTDELNFKTFLESAVVSIDEQDKNSTIKASTFQKSQRKEPESKIHILKKNCFTDSFDDEIEKTLNLSPLKISDSKSIFDTDETMFSSLNNSDTFVSEMGSVTYLDDDDSERKLVVSLPKDLIQDDMLDILNETEELICLDSMVVRPIPFFMTTPKFHDDKKAPLDDDDSDSSDGETECNTDKKDKSLIQSQLQKTATSMNNSFDLSKKITHPDYMPNQVRMQITDPYLQFSSRSSSTLPANFGPLDRKFGRRENYAALNVAVSQQTNLLNSKIPKKPNVVKMPETNNELTLPWLNLNPKTTSKPKRKTQLPTKPLQVDEQITGISKNDFSEKPPVPDKFENLCLSDTHYQTLPLRSSFSDGDLNIRRSINCQTRSKKDENMNENLSKSIVQEQPKSQIEIETVEISSVSPKLEKSLLDQSNLKKSHPLRHSFSAENIQPSADASSFTPLDCSVEGIAIKSFSSVSQMQAGSSQSFRSGIRPGGPRPLFGSSANSQVTNSNGNGDKSGQPPESTLERIFGSIVRTESRESGSLRNVWNVTTNATQNAMATFAKRRSVKFSLKNPQLHTDLKQD